MRQFIISLLLSILLLAICAAYVFGITAINKDPAYTDFGKFYQSAKLFWEGKSIYQPSTIQCVDNSAQPPQYKEYELSGNLNAPFFTLLILPFSLLKYADAITLWQLASFLAGLMSVAALLRIYNVRPWYHPAALAICVAVLGYYPSFLNLQSGQVGLMMLLATIGVWQFSRTGADKAAGMVLGLLISVKIFYGIFILFFFLQKRWRIVNWTIGSYLICFLLALWVFGKQSYIDYQAVLNQIYWYSSSWNGSIWGMLIRLFGYHEKNIPLLDLPGITKGLYYAASALLLIIYVKQLRASSKINQLLIADLNFSLTLVLMLLISPLGWAYYFPLLVIPLAALWRARQLNTAMLLVVVLAGIALLLSGTPTLLLQPWQLLVPKVILTSGSYYCYALILLFGILWWAIRAMKHSSSMQLINNKRILIVFYCMMLLPSIVGTLGVYAMQRIYYEETGKKIIAECK